MKNYELKEEMTTIEIYDMMVQISKDYLTSMIATSMGYDSLQDILEDENTQKIVRESFKMLDLTFELGRRCVQDYQKQSETIQEIYKIVKKDDRKKGDKEV